MSDLVLSTTTPEATRDAIIEWIRSEAGFHRSTARFQKGKRAKEACISEADIIDSLADSLAKYRTPAEIEQQKKHP